jgi:hypothetical protein
MWIEIYRRGEILPFSSFCFYSLHLNSILRGFFFNFFLYYRLDIIDFLSFFF